MARITGKKYDEAPNRSTAGLQAIPFLLKPRQEPRVGCGEFVLTKLIGRNPGKGLAMDRSWFVLPPLATIKSKAHRAFRIIVRQFLYERADLNLNAQFLAQFALEAFCI